VVQQRVLAGGRSGGKVARQVGRGVGGHFGFQVNGVVKVVCRCIAGESGWGPRLGPHLGRALV
jgi:hypothetical protein